MKLDLDTLYEVKRSIFEQMAGVGRDHAYGMAIAKQIVRDMIEEAEVIPIVVDCGSCGKQYVRDQPCYSCSFNTAHESEILYRKRVDELESGIRERIAHAKHMNDEYLDPSWASVQHELEIALGLVHIENLTPAAPATLEHDAADAARRVQMSVCTKHGEFDANRSYCCPGCKEEFSASGSTRGDKHIPWVEEPVTLGDLLGNDDRCGICRKLLEHHSPEERRACTEKFLADPKNYRLKP